MGFIWRILGVAYRNYIFFKRQWMWLAQSVMYTVGFMIIFTLWAGISALKHMIIVFLITSGWGTGLNVIAQTIGWDRITGEYEKRVASPLSLIEYLLGMVIGNMYTSGAVEIPIIIYAASCLDMDLLGLLLVYGLSFLATFIGLFLSLSIILRIKNPMNISAVTNPLYSLTVILPPVFYPPTFLPEPIRTYCVVIPTTALVDLGRALTGQTHAYPLWMSSLSLLAWLIIATILAGKKLKWGLE